MKFELVSIKADRIDLSDKTFCITKNPKMDDIMSSILFAGVLNPPFVFKKNKGFAVLSGFRRIKACKAIGLNRIDVRVVDEKSSLTDRTYLAISENALQRELNVIERSRASHLLLNTDMDRDAIGTLSSSLGLASDIKALKKFSAICRMPVKIQDGLLTGAISMPTAIHIEKMNKESATAFTNLFFKIKTSLNVQRELLSVVTDICARDDISVSAFFQKEEIQAILSDEKIDGPQKTNRIRAVIKGYRFPKLNEVEKRFGDCVKTLKLQPGIQITPPKFFESETYRVILSVRDEKDLENLTNAIDTIIGAPHLFKCDR